MSVSAHDIGRTFDCAWPGCPREARREGGYCDEGHVGERPAAVHDGDGRIIPGALAHLSEEATVACKIDGCTNESAGKGGWCIGLCDAHISQEGQRRQAVRYARKRDTSTDTPAREKAATPASKPIRVDTPQGQKKGCCPPDSLTDLARSVDTAAGEVREARGRHDRAVAALRAALDASP